MSIPTPEIFIINLDRREDRWTRISGLCNSLNLSYTRISAIEDEEPWIGCGLSHLKCISIAKERGLPWIIILEDDAEFDRDGLAHLNSLLGHLWYNRECWDRFSGGPHFGAGDLQPMLTLFNKHYHLFYFSGLSTHFNLIHSGAYEKILKWRPDTDREIDVFYLRAAYNIGNIIRSICSYPHVATQGSSYSDITRQYELNMDQFAAYSSNKLLSYIECTHLHPAEVIELRICHPTWRFPLLLSRAGNVVQLKDTNIYGRYIVTDDLLTIKWYRHGVEIFERQGDTYVFRAQ
jgi:GR25 family glycosyltransferase involved in LPS biosynthesis